MEKVQGQTKTTDTIVTLLAKNILYKSYSEKERKAERDVILTT